MLASLPILSSLRELLTPLRSCFPRKQTFANFVAITFGLLMARGRGCLSEALVAGGLVGKKHWSAFYRFFSRSPWSLDELGLGVARLIISTLLEPGAEIVLAGDDTLHAKGGAKIFGAGMHRDPLASTRSRARFQFGHCWVVLSIVVRLPFASRPRALPVLFRLNVPKKACSEWGVEHAKKTEQLAEMMEVFAEAFPGRHFRLVADDAYSNKTVLQRLPERTVMIGRLNLNARLHGPVPPREPGTMGRPRDWGHRLPSPREMAESCDEWPTHTVRMYGREVEVKAITCRAWWASAGPHRELRIVIVWRPGGQYPYEAFYCTDPERSVAQILAGYAERWPLEVTFRESKQVLGANRGQPRTARATARYAPFKMLLYSLVVLWYHQHGHGSAHATWRHRPWYRHKRTASFEDMCLTFRKATFESLLSPEVGRRPPSRKVQHKMREWIRRAA